MARKDTAPRWTMQVREALKPYCPTRVKCNWTGPEVGGATCQRGGWDPWFVLPASSPFLPVPPFALNARPALNSASEASTKRMLARARSGTLRGLKTRPYKPLKPTLTRA